jgi:DNA replication licensing factor MCM3
VSLSAREPTGVDHGSGDRLKLFRERVAYVFNTKMPEDDAVFLNTLVEHINEGLPTDALFGTAEVTEGCMAMQDAEELMISEGIVYKI